MSRGWRTFYYINYTFRKWKFFGLLSHFIMHFKTSFELGLARLHIRDHNIQRSPRTYEMVLNLLFTVRCAVVLIHLPRVYSPQYFSLVLLNDVFRTSTLIHLFCQLHESNDWHVISHHFLRLLLFIVWITWHRMNSIACSRHFVDKKCPIWCATIETE
jgi:hypothetical protein